jgi:hypothetical protein
MNISIIEEKVYNGTGRTLSVHSTEKLALAKARTISKRHGVALVIVHVPETPRTHEQWLVVR